MSGAVFACVALLWLGALFGTALHAERHPDAWSRHWRHVYALSLAVHCTSWTFYGTVTQAARHGWPFPPTFLGAILFYLLAFGFMLRLVALVRETNASSISDLIATRLGRDTRLAALVTAVVALGLVPYLALQLKAVAMSAAMLSTRGTDAAALPAWQDSALYVALAMALFAMLFGTRRADATEHHRGLVLALAFEGVFKLAAMLAIGAFVWFGLDAGIPAPAVADAAPADGGGGFVPLVLLGALAMFILPHQFHVAAVECRDASHVHTARWLFPLYLVLIALPVLPVARAGQALLGGTGIPSDLYVLALPLAAGHEGLAMFAFLGGLGAATGMVVVGTLVLSVMIGNHWLAPGLLRGAWRHPDAGDLRGVVLLLRRAGILAIMLLAWAYSRLVAGNEALADVGAVSFSALATLAPALGFAVWRPQTPAFAASAGIVAGFAAWCWVLLVPLLLASAGSAPAWLDAGPWAPDAFLGLTGWSRLGRAVGVSLFVGVVVTQLAASLRRERHDHPAHDGLDATALLHAGRRFLASERVEALLRGAPASGPVPPAVEQAVERELSAVLGSASARVLLDAARRATGRELETVATIVDEASQDLRFNQRVLGAALQNMSQGISVVDARLQLVAWNRRYEALFDYPPELLQVGRPVAELTAWNLRKLGLSGAALQDALERRMAFMRAGTAHLSERTFAWGDGGRSIIEIRGNPMPGGGFVATFTDVTAFRQAEAGLKQANETLEQRVAERTALLEAAKAEAERANDAKSRFLTAIGHDLLQPLHAAHLFTDALAQQVPPASRPVVRQVRGALDSTTDLLTGLLDMSRLEAGGLVPEPRAMPLSDVLDPLVSEFAALASERALRFRCVRTRAWTHTDPQLLRRVLQNFLANAVRYTASGTVLLGVRRHGDGLRIEVHDTGPGIPASQRLAIFEEFQRGEQREGPGLGLGLSIARRIAQLLGAPIALHSQPGRGSVFSVRVPALPRPREADATSAPSGRMAGRRLLVVDNEPQARAALQAILEGWGCTVVAVDGSAAALAAMAAAPADAWLLDYHLDDGETGMALHARLRAAGHARPAVVLTADASPLVRADVQEAGLPLLMKPVKPLALKSVLDRLLAARGVEAPDPV